MKEINVAIFAQLSYNNYYQLNEESLLLDISAIHENEWTDVKPNYFDEEVIEKQQKREDVKVVNGEKKVVKLYSPKDSRIFSELSLDELDPFNNKFFENELKGWKILLAKDHKQIFMDMTKEKRCCISHTYSGFQGTCFYNEKTKEAVIAYRGSDMPLTKLLRDANITGDWLRTNLSLGIGGFPDQLYCVGWFYDRCMELLSEKQISKVGITGHSLGGALAQFAHIYSGGRHKTITWSSLGIGTKYKGIDFNILRGNEIKTLLREKGVIHSQGDYGVVKKAREANDSKESFFIYANPVLKLSKEISLYGLNEISSTETFRINHIDEKIIKEVIGFNNNDISYYMSDGNRIKLPVDETATYIMERLKYLKVYSENYEKATVDAKSCINYFSDYDITPHIQEGIGYYKCLETGVEGIGFDRNLDITIETFSKKKTVSDYHGIFCIFAFLDDNKKIQAGKLQHNYFLNGLGTIIKKDKNLRAYIGDKLEISKSNKIEFDISEYCNINKLERDELFEDLGYSTEIIEYLDKNLKNWYLEVEDTGEDGDENRSEVYTGKKYKIGSFNNNEELLGVAGGFEVEVRGINTLEMLKQRAAKRGKKIDNVVLNLLEYFYSNDKLNRLGSVYKSAKRILDSRDLYIHDFLNVALVENIKRIELQEMNQSTYVKYNKNLEAMKSRVTKEKYEILDGLEETLSSGYKKEAYLTDNNLGEDRSRKLDKDVFERVAIKTKGRSFTFLESFLLEEEKAIAQKKEKEDREKEEYAKLKKEDDDLVAIAKDKKIEREARELDNQNGGWKISSQNGNGYSINYT